jgi:transcriptional regulator with XRE-family HTH domain
MGTTSRLIEVLPGQMREIALQLKRLRERLGITQEELAARYNRTAGEILSPEDLRRAGRMSRSRVAHIEQAHLPRPGKGVAITLQPHEVRILAQVLGVSPEQIVGDHAGGIITWDPLTNPKRAHHFLGLVEDIGKSAREMIGWAEFLPCSLETPAFMHGHHQAIFDADALHLPPEMRAEYTKAVVTMYDTIGNKRREDLVAAAASRPWSMNHLMLRPDIKSIAAGTGPYAGIDAEVRRGCLDHLRSLIADPALRINLVIAEEDEGLRHLFQGFDSLVVFDERFAFWRSYSGDIAYTTHPAIVRLRRALLDTFQANAVYRETGRVTRFLDDLVASMT